MDKKWEELSAPFLPSDVKYRVQSLWNDQACLLPYVDSRAVQNRLDSVLGPENWEDDYEEYQAPHVELSAETAQMGSYRTKWVNRKKQGEIDPEVSASLIQAHYQKGTKCTLKCRLEVSKEWTTKHGISDNTDIEGVKGGESHALRRAAVKFGIGRYLYDLQDVWVPIQYQKPDGDGWIWTRYSGKDIYYRKPDLQNFGAAAPLSGNGNTGSITVSSGTGKAAENTGSNNNGSTGNSGNTNTAGTGNTGSAGSTGSGDAPTALSAPELQDLMARITALIQNNKEALDNFRQINDQPSSMDKISKMLGCLYFVATKSVAPGGEHEMQIRKVMTARKFGDMHQALVNILSDMESGIFK